MIGQLFMKLSDGNTIPMDVVKCPEFMPPETNEEDKHKVLADFSKPITLECTAAITYMSSKTRKWWDCLRRFGNWTAKGPIRMGMLKKAAMLERHSIKVYTLYRDVNGIFWYKRGDGAIVTLTIDRDEKEVTNDGN